MSKRYFKIKTNQAWSDLIFLLNNENNLKKVRMTSIPQSNSVEQPRVS